MSAPAPIILVVEDDPDFGAVLSHMLQALGYVSRVSRDGFEALKAVAELRPAAVIADVLLPHLNGFELTQRIKADEALQDTPVILMSSVYRNRQQMERDMADYGADAYIAKPFALPAIERLLSSILGNQGGADPTSGLEENAPPITPAAGPTIAAPEVPSFTPSPSPPPGASAEQAWTGEFPQPPFAEVLLHLFRRGLSGVLKVRWAGAWKRLYLLNGVVVAAESNSTNEALGALLLESGQVSEDDIDRATTLMQREGCQFGEALVRSNAISVAQRHQALRDQLRERALKCFRFQRGTFHFSEDPSAAKDRLTFEEHPVRLIFDGIRQYTKVNEVAAALGEHLEEFPVQTDRFAAYVPFLRGASGPWDRLLDMMDGREDVGALVGRGVIEMHDLLKGLWAMSKMGMIEFRSAPATSTRPVLALSTEDTCDLFEGVGSELPEVRATADRVLRQYMLLRGAEPWTILGVAHDADLRTAQVAADAKHALYHPDALPKGLSGQVRERAKELHHWVTQSLAQLQADRAVGRESDPHVKALGDDTEGAAARLSRALSRGRRALRTRAYAAALLEFERATELMPDSAEARALAGWCIFHLTTSDIAERVSKAEAMLREALALQPDLVDGHFYLGMLLKETGRHREAADHFDAATRCDPDHREARWHLQVMQFRTGSGDAEAQEQVAALWDRVIGERSGGGEPE